MGESTHTKSPPEGGLSPSRVDRSGGAKRRTLITAAIGHEADASEAKDYHRPSRGLGDCGDRTEETVALAVYAISEVKCIGVATIAPVAENERPKAARGVRACVNWDGADPSAGARVVCVNFAGSKAEVADK